MLLNPLPNEPKDLFCESDKENNEFPLEHQRLFSWVSSLPYKNCSLVTEIDDFRNGLVFSEILVELLPENKDFLKIIETSDLSYSNCLKNLDIVVKEIQTRFEIPQYLSIFTASDLFENDQKLIILLAFLYKEKRHPTENPKSFILKPPSASKSQAKTLGKPPLGPTIIPSSLQSMNIKPQISQSASKTPEEKKPQNCLIKIIQPKNPENFPSRNLEKKNEDINEIQENFEKIKNSMPKPEILSDFKKPLIMNNYIKPASLGNFRHFNQIAELSDLKPSPLPYLNPIENEEKTKVAMNLSNKFNTESPEKSEFSSIWFNPKPNLNKFSENPGKISFTKEVLEIDEKNMKKVNLHSILKNSSRNLKTSNNKSISVDNFDIPSMNSSSKSRLFKWLISIDLLKENLKNIIEKLPKICRNGVIYADIINRLEPRGEILKGIARKPKKSAEIHANFQKIFDFFSKFEKMNKRFLFNYQPFLEGNEGAFWGFLDDIWHFYHMKISNADMRFQDKFNSKRTSLNESYNNKRFFNSSKKSEFSNASYDEICQENHISNKFIKPNIQEKNNINTHISNKTKENYDTRAWTLPQKNEEPLEINKINKNIEKSRENTKKHIDSSFLRPEVLEWLKSLGFSSYFPRFSNQNPYENPLKNGIILSQILTRLHLAKVSINKTPKNHSECEKNLDFIFQALRKLPVSLPPEFTRKIPEILRSDDSLIFEILAQLKIYSEKSSRKSLYNNTSRLSVKSLTNSPLQRSLSHNDSSRFFFKINNDIENLESRLFLWLNEKGLLFENKYEDFSDLFPNLNNGVLFCDLAEKLCGISLIGITRKPLTEKAKRMNIQKAIDLLKERKILSVQGWSLANEEIYKGNYMFIMEILEALYQHDKGKMNDFLSNREINNNKILEEKEEIMKNKDLIEKSTILKGKAFKEKNIEKTAENTCKKLLENSSKTIRFNQENIEDLNMKNLENNERKTLDLWFKKLGIIGIIENLDFNQKIWPEFKDGLIFCKLIERLENKEIIGTNYKPRSSAACKANIKRVLEILRIKKDMNLKYLYDEDTLYEGLALHILEFLLQIKHAYRLTFKYFAKKIV